MFSTQPRVRYGANQLAQVICQLRFPEILSISENAPAAFQEQIRDEYPQFLRRTENAPPKITGIPGHFSVENQETITNYQFVSEDNVWRINLTGKFISLTCTAYTCWEDFAAKLDKPLAAFIQTYHPAYFERIGLRYLNFFSRYELGLENTPFRELFQPCYLGLLCDDDVIESNTTQSTVDAELALRGGCRVKLHAGPGLVKKNGKSDREIKFIFDQDLYMPGKIAVNLSAGALQTLHAQAFSVFRGAITDTLHDAMEPQAID